MHKLKIDKLNSFKSNSDKFDDFLASRKTNINKNIENQKKNILKNKKMIKLCNIIIKFEI